MKFKKVGDQYRAIRKDGQVIAIEKTDCGQWVSRYENDQRGDNTAFAKTKHELVESENTMEGYL